MKKPRNNQKKFIGTFVNEMYAILLGIGIGNLIFTKRIDLTSLFDIVMALFVTSTVLLYWWDWTEFISVNVVTTKREFVIDFFILIALTFLFGFYNSPLQLAFIFLVIGILDLAWVTNHLIQFRERYRQIGKEWIIEKILSIAIYFFFLCVIYFIQNLVPVWIQGGIVILGFVLVRNFGFSHVRSLSSIRLPLSNKEPKLQLRNPTSRDVQAIVEINNSYLNMDIRKGFLLNELNSIDIEKRINKNPEHYFVAEKNDGEIVGFVEMFDSVEKTIIDELTWLDPELQKKFESEKNFYIQKIAVKVKYQRQKIGHFIYNSLFERYKDANFYVFIVLKPVTNIPSLQYHLQMNFLKAAFFRSSEFCGLKNYESVLLLKT